MDKLWINTYFSFSMTIILIMVWLRVLYVCFGPRLRAAKLSVDRIRVPCEFGFRIRISVIRHRRYPETQLLLSDQHVRSSKVPLACFGIGLWTLN